MTRTNGSRVSVFLMGCIDGPVDKSNELVALLQQDWHLFDGHSATCMSADKLPRIEKLAWHHPVLSFEIVRHGAQKFGSKLAEVQHWQINLDSMQAVAESIGHRRVAAFASPVRTTQVGLVVREISEALAAGVGQLTDLVQWCSPDKVRIDIARIFPNNGPKKTLESRRNRLRGALRSRLDSEGWQELSPWFFQRR